MNQLKNLALANKYLTEYSNNLAAPSKDVDMALVVIRGRLVDNLKPDDLLKIAGDNENPDRT